MEKESVIVDDVDGWVKLFEMEKSIAVDVLLLLNGYYPWIIIKKGKQVVENRCLEDYVVVASSEANHFGQTFFNVT